jgi:LysM repeat protein
MRKIGFLIMVVAVIVLLALPMAASAETAQTAVHYGCTQYYTIHCGDTLNKIARQFGTSASYLAAINGIANPNYIVAGTTICVRATHTPPPPPPPAHGGFYYTVKCGDTLGNIGWKYGWGALTLARVNGIPNPDRIYPGQVLWIPAH